MPRLVALSQPLSPELLAAVDEIWDAGDAVALLDPGAPVDWQRRVTETIDPHRLIDHKGSITDRPDAAPLADGDALVMLTSGSTGTPRAAILTHDALDAAAAMSARRLEQQIGDRWALCLPPWHIGGFSVFTRARLGGIPVDVVAPPAIGGLRSRSTRSAERPDVPTMIAVVPAMFQQLDPAEWRTILLGGARPPEPRPSHCIATYGMTETAAGIVYDGVPLEGVTIEIGPSSEVLVRSPTLLRAYRGGAAPIDDRGFLHTGDLGALEPDGSLRILGRRDLAMSTGGETVLPEPLETRLAAHPSVVDLAVGGRPHPRWGEEVTAVVVVHEGTVIDQPLLDELRGLADDMPVYARPRALVVVETIPRTRSGKIDRSALRRLLESSDGLRVVRRQRGADRRG